MYSMGGFVEYCVVLVYGLFILFEFLLYIEFVILGCVVFIVYGVMVYVVEVRGGDFIVVIGIGGVGFRYKK